MRSQRVGDRVVESVNVERQGTAAFLVLEAAKPWSRKTHTYFPAPARARAVELWPWGFRFSRRFPREEQAMYDVWMTIVMGQAVTRDYQPPTTA